MSELVARVNTTTSSYANAVQQPFDIEAFELSAGVRDYIEYEESVKFLFHSRNGDSIEKTDALRNQEMINKAKRNIRELQAEIEKWEQIINISSRAIRKYKRHQKDEPSNRSGRPARSEYREQVVKKFTMQWVASLMDVLEVKGCGSKQGLEMLVPTVNERKWRRWLNGESIPSYSNFEQLLSENISRGKYSGKVICDVPVTPNHGQVSTLLQFL
jgi:hypothetical protein